MTNITAWAKVLGEMPSRHDPQVGGKYVCEKCQHIDDYPSSGLWREKMGLKCVNCQSEFLRKCRFGIALLVRSRLIRLPPAEIDFGRWSDRSRMIAKLARQEAQRLNHAEVRPRHLLLGIVKEGSGAGGTILSHLGVNTSNVRTAIKSAIASGDQVVIQPQWSEDLCDVFADAADIAKSFGENYIGSEHLLLALTRKQRDIVVDSILEPHALTIKSVLGQLPKPALPKELQPDASHPVTFREFL